MHGIKSLFHKNWQKVCQLLRSYQRSSIPMQQRTVLEKDILSSWKDCSCWETTNSEKRVAHRFCKPMAYTDINNKEWIVCLLPPYHHITNIQTNEKLKSFYRCVNVTAPIPSSNSHPDHDTLSLVIPAPPPLPLAKNNSINSSNSQETCDSFLYDVENDKFIPFIKNYESDINEKFGIGHHTQGAGMSFVIDNKNHILYWLDSSHGLLSVIKRSLIALDIKDLKNIKLLYQSIIPCDDKNSSDNYKYSYNFPGFTERYKMFIVENTIQFIENSSKCLKHYQFDLLTRKLSLVHDNIHSSSVSHVTQLKIENVIKNLKVKDWIDIKDDKYNKFYLAQILHINYALGSENEINENEDIFHGSKIAPIPNRSDLESRKIIMAYVKYYGLDKQYNEWIQINCDAESLTRIACDCDKKCIHISESRKYHMIALPRSQSTLSRDLFGTICVYLEKYGQMMILGPNDKRGPTIIWNGMYCKCINPQIDWKRCLSTYSPWKNNYNDNDNYKMYVELMVFGFIHQIEIKYHDQETNIVLPKDLCNMILKYCFIPGDKEWERCGLKCFEGDLHWYWAPHSSHVLVNNENMYDLFVFREHAYIDKYRYAKQSILRMRISNDNRLDVTDDDHGYSADDTGNYNTNQIRCQFKVVKNSDIRGRFEQIFKYQRCHAVLVKQTHAAHIFINDVNKCSHYSISLLLMSQ